VAIESESIQIPIQERPHRNTSFALAQRFSRTLRCFLRYSVGIKSVELSSSGATPSSPKHAAIFDHLSSMLLGRALFATLKNFTAFPVGMQRSPNAEFPNHV
jgi:hypothetical protein